VIVERLKESPASDVSVKESTVMAKSVRTLDSAYASSQATHTPPRSSMHLSFDLRPPLRTFRPPRSWTQSAPPPAASVRPRASQAICRSICDAVRPRFGDRERAHAPNGQSTPRGRHYRAVADQQKMLLASMSGRFLSSASAPRTSGAQRRCSHMCRARHTPRSSYRTRRNRTRTACPQT
jgi:hypothetical protein